MAMQNLENWFRLVSDRNVLSVLFYLEKYNPTVRIKELQKNLNLDEKQIGCILSELKNENMVEVSARELIELTEQGRIAVQRLMAIA